MQVTIIVHFVKYAVELTGLQDGSKYMKSPSFTLSSFFIVANFYCYRVITTVSYSEINQVVSVLLLAVDIL
jgi:hypothetical protein